MSREARKERTKQTNNKKIREQNILIIEEKNRNWPYCRCPRQRIQFPHGASQTDDPLPIWTNTEQTRLGTFWKMVFEKDPFVIRHANVFGRL